MASSRARGASTAARCGGSSNDAGKQLATAKFGNLCGKAALVGGRAGLDAGEQGRGTQVASAEALVEGGARFVAVALRTDGVLLGACVDAVGVVLR